MRFPRRVSSMSEQEQSESPSSPAIVRKSPRRSGSGTSNTAQAALIETPSSPIARGGVACPFPWRLHQMLDYAMTHDLSHIISWDTAGKSFSVWNSKAFVRTILPRFFSQSKYASFQRQINLYGFRRATTAHHTNGVSCYFHEHFTRGQPAQVSKMIRCKIKGTGKKRKEELHDGDLLFFEGSPFHFLECTEPRAVVSPSEDSPAMFVQDDEDVAPPGHEDGSANLIAPTSSARDAPKFPLLASSQTSGLLLPESSWKFTLQPSKRNLSTLSPTTTLDECLYSPYNA